MQFLAKPVVFWYLSAPLFFPRPPLHAPQQQQRERELRKQHEREQRRRYEEMEQLRREEERRHAEREQVHKLAWIIVKECRCERTDRMVPRKLEKFALKLPFVWFSLLRQRPPQSF